MLRSRVVANAEPTAVVVAMVVVIRRLILAIVAIELTVAFVVVTRRVMTGTAEIETTDPTATVQRFFVPSKPVNVVIECCVVVHFLFVEDFAEPNAVVVVRVVVSGIFKRAGPRTTDECCAVTSVRPISGVTVPKVAILEIDVVLGAG